MIPNYNKKNPTMGETAGQGISWDNGNHNRLCIPYIQLLQLKNQNLEVYLEQIEKTGTEWLHFRDNSGNR